MPLSSRRRALGLKAEANEGAYYPPTATDANLQIYETKFNATVGLFKRNPLRNNLSKLTPVVGIKRVTITGKCEIRGPDDVGGNLGTPEIDNVLKANGWKRVNVYLTTTVDADSASGQPVLNVTSTTGFAVGNIVLIGEGNARNEVLTILSVQAGVSITLTANLASAHTAVQADVVKNLSNVSSRAYSPTSDFDTGQQTTTTATSAAAQAILTVPSNVGFSPGDRLRVNFSTSPPTGTEYVVAMVPFGVTTSMTLTTNIAAEVPIGAVVQNLDSLVGYPMSGMIEEDGRVKKFRGARGNGNWECKVGEPGFFSFTMDAALEEVVDAVPTFVPTYGTKVPPAFLGAALTLGGSYANSVFTTLSIGTNNELAPRESANDPRGLKSTLITDRSPGGSFDPEATLEAENPVWAQFLAGTPVSLSVKVGSVSKNRVTITAPAIVYATLADDDRNNIAVDGVAFECATVTAGGNDEIVVTYD